MSEIQGAIKLLLALIEANMWRADKPPEKTDWNHEDPRMNAALQKAYEYGWNASLHKLKAQLGDKKK